jgi:PBP1b-binding outer membrane lipoprotein LpoB
MKKLKEFLEKYLLHIIVILFLLITWNNCSMSKTNKKYVKELHNLTVQVDSLKNNIPNEERLELYYEKQMYEFAKITLYDWNSVVRTTKRPDDLLVGYDLKIKEINNKIKK